MSRRALAAASKAVVKSTMADCASVIVTTAINASAPTLTPSRKAPTVGHRRRRGMSGPLIATKTNEGRKMPIVAMMAPPMPPRT